MNEKNVEYLKDQLKYTGFGDAMENALVESIQKGNPEFKLDHEIKYGADTVLTSLNFKKSEQSDMYFFNSYDMNIQKEGRPVEFSQTFYINRDNNITAKEAYNLMEGRAVNKDLKNKEDDLYNSWVKIDFKNDADEKGNFKLNHYHQNYGYDLEASLAKHPIKELDTLKYKDDLISSLKKGNIQSVTFVIGGEERKQFVEANPHFKTVNVYDSAMRRINDRDKDLKKNETESKSSSMDVKQKQEVDSESPETGAKKNTKKKKSNSI